jgi:uncharacterized protein DUF3551
MQTRTVIVIACGVFVATAFIGSEPAEAAGSRDSYCLEYDEGGTNCGFTSAAQCHESAVGIAAECSAVEPLAAMQEPGAHAFYHPDASLGIEAVRTPRAVMASVPMRSRHASRVRGHDHGT